MASATVSAQTRAMPMPSAANWPWVSPLFNPGDGEEIHAVFLGGTHTPARVRCFVDYLVERFQ